ncbi:unnamed protein product [Lathyrus sativus]|nr:unnamed protein product [Lathyrus sativus]
MLNNNGYKSKQRSSTASGYICRIQVLVMSFTLMLMLVILFLVFDNVHDNDNHGVKVKVKPSLAYDSHKQKWNSFDSLVKLHPTREFRNGTDLIWQVPESPKGVLFLAHGCNGKAINFWDKSSECPDCVGLPEERLLVLHGLAEGFAVITISSARRCWSYGNNEVLIVKDILEWWIGERKLEKLPLVALGASSGGYFVSLLATAKKFNSIVLMIAEGMFEEIDIEKDYPPTLFVHMPKDFYRQRKIDEYVEVLKGKGIDVGVVECMEFPLSPDTLIDRIPGMDQHLSRTLFEVFKERGLIDRNGYMKQDGRKINWRKVIQEKINLDIDERLVPHVQEELNLAFAYHEMTSVHSDRIFKWFKSHLS